MQWIYLALSLLGALGVANALWPVRRPWWLKTPSFNSGWFPNELPVHVLAGNVVVTAIAAGLGVLDERAGQVGLVLTVVSSVGLVVLAAAHREARSARDQVARASGAAPRADEPWPRSWRVIPWLAWASRRDVERIPGIRYASVGGRDLKLDLYRPRSGAHGCPVLVEIHGGGWVMGDRRFDARPLMTRLAAHGWVCVSIDYRLSRKATWPDHIVDVKTALAWAAEHIAEYGGDPDFVAVTGGSSGGHLAALAALDSGPGAAYEPLFGTVPPIRACVPFYGVYDFDNRLGLRTEAEVRQFLEKPVVKVSRVDAPGVYDQASPLARVHADAPPFLVVQGTTDNLVQPAESRAFVDRLRAVSHSPVVYAEIERAHHAFDAVPSLRTRCVVEAVEHFLAQVHAASHGARRAISR